MRSTIGAKSTFVTLWAALLLAKLAIAARLPLFVDEVFYWQEGRHLAWAYSDLPGLTAWLTRLGGEVFGDGVLALRLPFLAIAAALPWLVVRIARRVDDDASAWVAGCAALLLPLLATLGLLALPDVAMTFATALCLDAITRLLRGVDAAGALELALGLVIGGLSHYRFVAVIGAGFIALLLLAEGRRLLREPRVLAALAAGAAAWIPLLWWNLANAEAGLRFQLVDRHPWALHADGVSFLAVQAAVVTPLLAAALLAAGWADRRHRDPARRLLAWAGGIVVAGFFVLGFVADSERVSFHWPLPGWLALLPLLPQLLERWRPWLRASLWALAGLGALAALGFHLAVSSPGVRAQMAALKWYPSNFAGWDALAATVADARAQLPPGTRLVADNFKLGAELGFVLGDPRIPVLDHPLNHHHGRAPQLRLWALQWRPQDLPADTPVLLVVGASDVPYRDLLRRYHALCDAFGPLPPPQVLNVDHGRRRFLLLAWPDGVGAGSGSSRPCTAPAMAWIDRPLPRAVVGEEFEVAGWAFKDGAGIARVDVTLDGVAVARAEYGAAMPEVAGYWGVSTDPQHPRVGFRATVRLEDGHRGRRWLGLTLHGHDGSVEAWSEQPVAID